MTGGAAQLAQSESWSTALHDQLAIQHAPVFHNANIKPGAAGGDLFLEDSVDGGAIALPPPELRLFHTVTFEGILEARHSTRLFEPDPLDATEVSTLLGAALGARGARAVAGVGDIPYRASPSAGGLESTEAYVIARNTSRLAPGIYRYQPRAHSLSRVADVGSVRVAMLRVCRFARFTNWMVDAPVLIVLVGRLDRLEWKYGRAAYRLIHLDAGAALQTLYLAAGAMGLGICASAGFDWEAAAEVLALDSDRELVVASLAVGKTRTVASRRLPR